MTDSKTILAVDPGFDRMGVAVLREINGKPSLLYSCCIKTDVKDPHNQRLFDIGDTLREIIKEWKPRALAIETLFFNQNTTSALKVAEARGIAMYEATRSELEVYEYSPQAIKIAVTSYGKASKPQVKTMVMKLIDLGEDSAKQSPRLDDELDAIALGITHLASCRGIC